MRCAQAAFFGILMMAATSINAQNFCDNELVYFHEDFGTGTTVSSNPNVLTSTLAYMPTGVMEPDGYYRIINNTQQKPEWHNSPDHTPGDVNGKMLVANGAQGDFYQTTVTSFNGFQAGFYSLSAYVMNVNTPGTCSPTGALLPSLSLKVEYLNLDNEWVPMGGSPVVTNEVPQSQDPTWVVLGGVFTLPTNGTALIHDIRITVGSATEGGCGNDFALDDIVFATCPSGGPLPVSFMGISAKQKGTGVAIDWSTASEYNNNYFIVERSNNGGRTWFSAARVSSQGNSSTEHQYTAYDAKPEAGVNFYRIRQVDFDGTSKYSSTAIVKITIDRTTGTVLANPFISDITLDFLSTRSQTLNVSVFDNTGRQVIRQQLTLGEGASRQRISANQLQKGMYVIQVRDADGNMIINNKLIKM